VELPVAAVVGLCDGRVAHEHIYCDQASVLVQVGALDPAGLPVTGAEQARKMLDRSLAPNALIPGWVAG
jgi:carboxymethylenebutenolidase